MCSKLGFWGYGQIAQFWEKGEMFVYIVHADNISDYVRFKKQKKRVCLNPVKLGLAQTPCGGELGIRTPDSFHYASFQDWCIQPLYQLSIFSCLFLRTIYSICDVEIKIKCFLKIFMKFYIAEFFLDIKMKIKNCEFLSQYFIKLNSDLIF